MHQEITDFIYDLVEMCRYQFVLYLMSVWMKLNIYGRNSFADINSSVKSVCFAFLVKTMKDITHFIRIST